MVLDAGSDNLKSVMYNSCIYHTLWHTGQVEILRMSMSLVVQVKGITNSLQFMDHLLFNADIDLSYGHSHPIYHWWMHEDSICIVDECMRVLSV